MQFREKPSEAALQQEAIWRLAKEQPKLFIEAFCKIRVPGRKGLSRFKLTWAQADGLEHWVQNRYSITLKARQIGWSTLIAGYSLWRAITIPYEDIIMISRTEREAAELMAKAALMYTHLPGWVRSKALRENNNKQVMEFSNGSRITSMPSASDPARGSSASLIVVDEWAFLQDPEGAWASIEPVADVGGQVIGLSTANGSGNWFHETWVGAETGHNLFKPFFVPWWGAANRHTIDEDGTIVPDELWYAEKLSAMRGWQLHQEYPENAEEAFIRSGNPVFDAEWLDYEIVKPREGYITGIGGLSFVEQGGPVSLWHMPETTRQYVVGVDVAKGLEHGDFSSAHVLDADTGRLMASWHGHIPPDLFADELILLGNFYNGALMVPENNNHGLSTIDFMRQKGYKRIYRTRTLDETTNKYTVKVGFNTNVKSKPLLIDALGSALRQDAIHVHCEYTLAELRTYVRNAKGGMEGSPHDDRVMSLALAVEGMKHVHTRDYQEEHSDKWTGAWWRRQLPSLDRQGHRIGGRGVRPNYV